MRTIAFVTQKGGAGKSTLAFNLSVTARLAGERVVLLDLDPLQSLVKWAKLRKGEDLPVEFVPAQKLQKTLETLEKKGVSLVVLDAPGHDGAAQDAAIAGADLIVIPARPNVFDLWASEVTRAKVKAANKEYAFLLNQCPPAQQSQRVELGAKALQAMGGLLSPLVSARVDFQEAARQGLGVSELHPSGEAAAEMHELWASAKRRIKKSAKPEAKSEKKAESRPAAQSKPEAKPAVKAAPEAPAKVAAKTAAKPAKPIEKAEAKAQEKPGKAAVKLTVVKAA
ncbi:MAG TPA: ParA family protein [Methylocystis sp.]|nr:ParA family protein [Methylocystis sp.]